MNDRRETILQAMLELVAERGLQDAPMSLLAKRAGASAGIIYHYFSGKDELLRTLYVQVKAAALAGVDAVGKTQKPPREAFGQMWVTAYRYFAERRAEALFIDRFEGAPGYKTPEVVALLEEDEGYSGLVRWLETGTADRTLKRLPVGLLYELSFAVAPRMVVRREPLDEAMQTEIAACCWQAIAR